MNQAIITLIIITDGIILWYGYIKNSVYRPDKFLNMNGRI